MGRHLSPERTHEHLLVDKANRQLLTADGLIEKIRWICLQRGVEGIIGFGKMFRRMDKDKSGNLSREEFSLALKESGLNGVTNHEVHEIFKRFDENGDGTVNYDEFLLAIRPPLNDCRLNVINMAYDKMDVTGDGEVTYHDLKKTYNVRSHPSFINGDSSENEIFKLWLAKFERNVSTDGILTRDEFLDFYSGVSASIDDDCYFDLMLRSAWKL